MFKELYPPAELGAREEGTIGVDDDFARRGFENLGAWIMGRNMFGPIRGAWPDDVILSLCHDLDLIHAVDPFIRPSLTPELTYWRLHGNKSHYASYTDDELRQIHAWIRPGVETYVMFNNIPRVNDVKRFRAMGLDQPADAAARSSAR